MKSINVNQVAEIKDAYIIDVREVEEFQANAIKGATNIPLQQFIKDPKKYLKQDQENYIVCLSGGRSTLACQTAIQAGVDNVTNLSGGMMGYFGNM